MVEPLYRFLLEIGFRHPLHPAFTHIPMGMALGAFLFALAALKWPQLKTTARYCIVLALIAVIPTAIPGILDWLHFYKGNLQTRFIIKFILAGVFTALLALAMLLGKRESTDNRIMIALYGLIALNAILLGFVGGEIQTG